MVLIQGVEILELRRLLALTAMWACLMVPVDVEARNQDPENHADAAGACSVLDGWIANAEAIGRGDVLIRLKSVVDTTTNTDGTVFKPDGVIQETTRWWRLAFDFERDFYCLLEQQWQKTTDLTMAGHPGGGVTEAVLRRASLSSSDEFVVQRLWPGETVRTEKIHVIQPPGRLRQFLWIPDVRSFGQSVQLDSEGFALLRQEVNRFRSGDRLVSHSLAGDRQLELVFWTRSPEEEEAEPGQRISRLIERFDLELQVPVYRSCRSWFEGRWKPLFVSEIEWQEKNGLAIPRQFHLSAAKVIQVGERELVGPVDHTLDFFWISVNEPLAEECFDGSRLATLEDFERHLDPERTGALKSWGESPPSGTKAGPDQ